MTADKKTIGVYNTKSSDYADMTRDQADDPSLKAFIARLPEKAYVLDLGCGPGHFAAEMIAAGHVVDAVDASPEMVKLAHKARVPARIARFSDIDENEIYDAVWASFSLLHAPKAEFPGLLNVLFKALVAGGVFCLGMKLGKGERRDSLGRFYSYYSGEELLAHLHDTGFGRCQSSVSSGAGLDGTNSEYIIITCRKPENA